MISTKDKVFFNETGYLVVRNILTNDELSYYDSLYNSFLDDSIDTNQFRSDLAGSNELGKEQITQIMAPSKLIPSLLDYPLHIRTLTIAKSLLGEDIALDFDMLINKAPFTNTITPWHQDTAYWMDMPDKRAVSCWVAIDNAVKDNGCMWYTPKSHLGSLLKHTQPIAKGALQCEGKEENSVCIELEPGSCVFHHGNTLHYSRGNSTKDTRRAFITNFRPLKMIKLERSQGYDHTGQRENKT